MKHAYNEFIAAKIDRAAFEHLKLTFAYMGEDTFPEDYCGKVKVAREARDTTNGREWFITFSILSVEPGTVNWEVVAEGAYAHVDGSDAAVQQINRIRRKFAVFQAGYNALDIANFPNCSFLMMCRAAQMVHDEDIEVVPFITNDMFCQNETGKVETLSILPVTGCQLEDIRRTDHLVISRKLDIGVADDLEFLCAWPIVICGNLMAFNQFIPGPVLSNGNLARNADVLDLNTKDVIFSANTPFELDYNYVDGTGTMRKYFPSRDKWVTYDIAPNMISPKTVE